MRKFAICNFWIGDDPPPFPSFWTFFQTVGPKYTVLNTKNLQSNFWIGNAPLPLDYFQKTSTFANTDVPKLVVKMWMVRTGVFCKLPLLCKRSRTGFARPKIMQQIRFSEQKSRQRVARYIYGAPNLFQKQKNYHNSENR